MTSPTPNDMPGAPAPQAADPAPEHPQEPQQQQPVGDPPAATGASPKPPPWGSDEEFDPQRAWNLVQNLKSELSDLKAKTDPVIAAQEDQRRAQQGELATAREDLTKAATELGTWRSEAVRWKAEALATGKFSDVKIALTLLGNDLSEYATSDGVDTQKLAARLDQIGVDHPILVAQAPQPQGFTPNRGQGQSGTGQIPIDAQIEAAQKAGNIGLSIALKQQKYAQQAQR